MVIFHCFEDEVAMINPINRLVNIIKKMN